MDAPYSVTRVTDRNGSVKAPSRLTARATTSSQTLAGSDLHVVTVERAIVSDIPTSLRPKRVTGQMTFDSHVFNLVDVASRLVNELTPGQRGGHPVVPPRGAARVAAVGDALGGDGRRTPHVTARQALALAEYAAQMRPVFEATDAGDLAEAARVLNKLLDATGARPQLDPLATGGYHVHF